MRKKFHCFIKHYLLTEIKKSVANRFYWDASFKEPKHLTHCNDMSIFKGPVSGTNELGEVRVKFHVMTDAYEQIGNSIEVFKNT